MPIFKSKNIPGTKISKMPRVPPMVGIFILPPHNDLKLSPSWPHCGHGVATETCVALGIVEAGVIAKVGTVVVDSIVKVGVMVKVGVKVRVEVEVNEAVGVRVNVGVDVKVGVNEAVGVSVKVGVGVTNKLAPLLTSPA